MTVAELMELLMTLPLDAKISSVHQEYGGGTYEWIIGDPALFTNGDKSDISIVSDNEAEYFLRLNDHLRRV
jgi:hypothetical protein